VSYDELASHDRDLGFSLGHAPGEPPVFL